MENILNEIEKNVIGVYDNDTIQIIIEYLQKRVKQIKEQLEEENK